MSNINKKLEELFDICDEEEKNDETESNSDYFDKNSVVFSKDEIFLSEIDMIKEKALDAYEKLLEAGMEAEPKVAEQYLKPAIDALSIAMNSENNKINKLLELERLKISKKRLLLEERKIRLYELRGGLLENEENSNVFVEDRNKILKLLMELENNENHQENHRENDTMKTKNNEEEAKE
jgi:hypothetical protein